MRIFENVRFSLPFFKLISLTGKHIVGHKVSHIACRSVSANYKCYFPVSSLRSAHSQFPGAFPHNLSKMASTTLPSTTTEVVIFDLIVP